MSLDCLAGNDELVQVVDPAWWMVGRSDEIADAGQYFSRIIGTEPVAVVRSATGAVKAHLNSCRHRGMQILTGTGKVKALRCPYHGWMYSLDGELRAAPEMSETIDFDKSDFPLKQLSVAEQSGSIYVNINGLADVETIISAEAREHFDEYAVTDFVTVRNWEVTATSNWNQVVQAITAPFAQSEEQTKIWKQGGPKPGTPPFGQMLPPNMSGEFRKGRTWVSSGQGDFTVLDEDMTIFLSVLPVGTRRCSIVARLSLSPRLAARAKGGDAELVPRLQRVATKTEAYLQGLAATASAEAGDERRSDAIEHGKERGGDVVARV